MHNYCGKLICMMAAVGCLAVSAHVAYATVIMGEFDWNPPETFETFDHHPTATVVDYPETGGNPGDGGWMRIEFPETGETPSRMWYDVISIPATNLFTGSWLTQMWVQFDFWQSNVTATALQIRWQSTINDSVWRSPLTIPPALDTWTTVAQDFNNWQEWQYPGADQNTFLMDLQNIDWIGVYIYRNTSDEQIYGIDNFRLMIPEPAELLMLLSFVAASGLSARRRRRRKHPG